MPTQLENLDRCIHLMKDEVAHHENANKETDVCMVMGRLRVTESDIQNNTSIPETTSPGDNTLGIYVNGSHDSISDCFIKIFRQKNELLPPIAEAIANVLGLSDKKTEKLFRWVHEYMSRPITTDSEADQIKDLIQNKLNELLKANH